MRLPLALLLLLALSNAFAFDVGGFRSGMPLDEALAVLKREGFAFDADQTASGHILAFRADVAHVLTFCNGRLTSYSYSLADGMRGFVRQVEETTTAHGAGSYRASSTKSDSGDLNVLEFAWRTGPDTLKITYALAKVKHTAESISVSQRVESVCDGK